LRWDSLGEFLALAVSLEHLSEVNNNPKALVLAKTLDTATSKFLDNDKSPTRRLGGIDNRGSHFYLSLYWAEALSNQTEDADLKAQFTEIYNKLSTDEESIVQELISVQGKNADVGGYYFFDDSKASQVMRPSETFNRIIN